MTHVAKILASKVRGRGDAYRWGGEEFIIVLENMSLSEVAIAAENIRLAVMNSVCRFNNQELRVTMSFGCA